MTTLIIFDCFGTLVDRRDRPYLPDAEEFARVLFRLGENASDAAHEIRDALIGSLLSVSGRQRPTVDLFVEVHRRRDLSLSRADAEAMANHAFGAISEGASLVPGTPELLSELHRLGHCLRVLSNCFAPGPTMDGLLSQLDVMSFFEARFWSSEIGFRKPERRVFELAGSGDFRRRVMVGDNDAIDLQPARELGWDVVSAARNGGHAAELLARL